MRPTEIIEEWFKKEDASVQADIAFLMTMSLCEEASASFELSEKINILIEWLTPIEEEKYRTVGKAISFIAVFEHLFSKRFTHDGWDLSRQMFENVIEENDNPKMVEDSKRMLADLPRRIEIWNDVGKRWQEVKLKLSPEAIDRWSFPTR